MVLHYLLNLSNPHRLRAPAELLPTQCHPGFVPPLNLLCSAAGPSITYGYPHDCMHGLLAEKGLPSFLQGSNSP